MARLNKQGFINVLTTVCLITVMSSSVIIGISFADLFATFITIMLGTIIPIVLIVAVWTENFAQHFLKAIENFKKQYTEDT